MSFPLASIFDFIPENIQMSFIIIVSIIILYVLNSWIFKKMKSVKSDESITKKVISFLIIFFGLIAFVVTVPLGTGIADTSLNGQILTLLGIIISAGIALSSTTILGNMMAGFMNHSMKRFRNGDFIQVGDIFGKVNKTSVFHTEVQLEDSNFISIPHLFMASNPVKVSRNEETIISTTVSLGYDVPRKDVENALEAAAGSVGLANPYVFITELGDFSIVYKVHGFLKDKNKYFSTISNLNGMVIDTLHDEDIEIVSPNFMNQRRISNEKILVKGAQEKSKPVFEPAPEELIFEEAMQSEKIEKKKDLVKEIEKKKESLQEKLSKAGDDKKEGIKSAIKRMDEMRERMEKSIEEQVKDMEE